MKELKTIVGTNKLYSIIFIYNGLLALFTLFTFLVVFRNDIQGGVVEYSIILKVYAIIAAIEYLLLLILIPWISGSKISHEWESNTMELLLVSSVGKMKIIVGKLLSVISLISLLACSSLPILSLVFIIGGITISQILEFLLFIISTTIFIASIGIFCSALLRRTKIAIISSYVILFLLTIGTVAMVWLYYSLLNYGLGYGEILANVRVPLEYILLFNPGISYIAMIASQIGNGMLLYEVFENIGIRDNILLENWFVISIILQVCISYILCFLAARRLKR